MKNLKEIYGYTLLDLEPEMRLALPREDSVELDATLEFLSQQDPALNTYLTSWPPPTFATLDKEIFVNHRLFNTEYWRSQETLLIYHWRECTKIRTDRETLRSDRPDEYWTRQSARRDWH